MRELTEQEQQSVRYATYKKAVEMLEELNSRIAKAKTILPDVDNDIVREALWNALEGK